MIAEEQNKALLIVGNSALNNVEWVNYANYCFEREKGNRKEAFVYLNMFITPAQHWSFDDKKAFIEFLFPFFENLPDADYGPFPQPLKEKIVKPALLSWCEVEKEDNRPFKWFGKYFRNEEYLLKALQIDPADDSARETLIGWWCYNIYYAVHHLPDGYIGEPEDDIELSKRIEEQISLLSIKELQIYWANELEEDLVFVRNYIEWRKFGHSNFEQWGQENNRQTNYRISRAYYYEK